MSGVLSKDIRPLTLSSPEHSRAVPQQEIHRHPDARYDHRLHRVLLAPAGMSCQQTAGLFGDSPRTLVNWVSRFDSKGLAGLAEGNHSGWPARLPVEQLEELRALVRQPPAMCESEMPFKKCDGNYHFDAVEAFDHVPVERHELSLATVTFDTTVVKCRQDSVT
jgi:transposase